MDVVHREPLTQWFQQCRHSETGMLGGDPTGRVDAEEGEIQGEHQDFCESAVLGLEGVSSPDDHRETL